jgi:hypothetical protein
MNKPNRDLLVMFKQELMDLQALEHEVGQLHELLFNVEKLDNLVAAHEAIDLNKYKLIKNQVKLRLVIRQKELKPFVFLNCKN